MSGSLDDIRRCSDVIGPSMFLTVLGASVLSASRPQFVVNECIRLRGGQSRGSLAVGEAARILSKMDSAGAVLELVCNPLVGGFSDCYGRRPFIPIAPVVATVTRLCVGLHGNLGTLWFDRLVTSATDSMYFTAWRAALADLTSLHGDSATFATEMARIGTYAGVAAILGPFVGARIRRARGESACFVFASLIASLNSLWCYRCFKETLSSTSARASSLKVPDFVEASNPCAFMRCFRRSSQLARIFLAVGLQTVTEGRCIGNVNYLLLSNDLGWSETAIARQMSGLGIGLILGGLIVKRSISMFGLRGHTTMANLTNAFVCVLWGGAGVIRDVARVPAALTMTVALTLIIPAARKRDGLEGLVHHVGSNAGFGHGFISAALMNWRAMFNISVPLLLGYVYAWAKSGGRNAPYLPFFLASAALLGSEACHRSLSNKEIDLDEKGLPLRRDDANNAAALAGFRSKVG
eukprot:TRINITY_DN38645_c0_g1_i1.p1 TRINITY_DN38645_c0_g1~~TRINITY_DN38645_c0_g1_i1.p1  ORF type:complete len:466 (-),score=23.54 TRINITY_DN38645_c0_g1_i1:225-1622(-)